MKLPEKPAHLFVLALDVTGACNLACPYCFQRAFGWSTRSAEDYPVKNILLKFRDVVSEYVGNKDHFIEVRLTGGEPFLDVNTLENYISLAKGVFGNDTRFVIFTNGTMIDFDFLADIARDTYLSVVVAPHVLWLDGEAYDGLRQKVKENTQRLFELQSKGILSTEVNVVVSAKDGVDASSYPEIVRWLVNLRRQYSFFATHEGELSISDDQLSRNAGDMRLVEIHNKILDAVFPVFREEIDARKRFDLSFYRGFRNYSYYIENAYLGKAWYHVCRKGLRDFAYFSRSGYIVSCPFISVDFYRSFAHYLFTIRDFLSMDTKRLLEIWDTPQMKPELLERFSAISFAKMASMCSNCTFQFCPASAFSSGEPMPYSREKLLQHVAYVQTIYRFHRKLVKHALAQGYSVELPRGLGSE